jgi:fructokinase
MGAVQDVGAGDTFQAALLCALAELGVLRRDALHALSVDTLRGVLSFAARACSLGALPIAGSPS